MHKRSLVFLLFFFVSTHLLTQGQDGMTAVNNPFEETVRPVLEIASGQLVVKLVNGFRETVVLTRVALSQDSSGPRNLLKTATEIAPAETKYFNTDFRGIDLRQQIRLLVDVSPRPPQQRREFVFRFESGTRQFVEDPSTRPGSQPPTAVPDSF